MNTKLLKTFIIYITILTLFGAIAAKIYTQHTNKQRQIAELSHKAGHELTDKQFEKWTVVEKFNIKQNNDGLIIEAPHGLDLCLNQTTLNFIFKAYQIAIAGENPLIKLSLSCNSIAQNLIVNLNFADFKNVQTNNPAKLPFGVLTADNIYRNEAFPEAWLLTEINIQGETGFVINEYEIQKVFNQNFEFLVPTSQQ